MYKSIIAGLVLATFGVTSVQAGDYHHHRPSKSPYSYSKHEFKNYGQYKKHHNGRNQLDYAKVVHARPITRTLSHRVPHETCWNEQVRYVEPRHSSATPAIVGGIIGATLGHSLGSDKYKTNRTIKTVALGALGASIGNDLGKRSSSRDVRYGTEQRCEVNYSTRYEEEVIGYDVTYRYRGETFRTEMDYHPGKRVPVKVNVHPVL